MYLKSTYPTCDISQTRYIIKHRQIKKLYTMAVSLCMLQEAIGKQLFNFLLGSSCCFFWPRVKNREESIKLAYTSSEMVA